METEPIWYQYATFDDDGFVNGISDDAPPDAVQAYQEEFQQPEPGKPIFK
jgi:hypothetical protein